MRRAGLGRRTWGGRNTLAVACTLVSFALTERVSAQQSTGRTVAPICIGECKRAAGLRINWRDRDVQRVDGINVTIWSPHGDATGVVNGISVGLPIVGVGSANGILIGAFTAQAEHAFRGIGIGGLAAGADESHGTMGAALLVLGGRMRGISVAGLATIATLGAEGIAVGGAGVYTGDGHGIAVGGLAAHAGAYRGAVVSGLALFSNQITGVAVTGGVHRAAHMRGISVALINYARALKGLQLGAINIVADGRQPKFLPVLNWR